MTPAVRQHVSTYQYHHSNLPVIMEPIVAASQKIHVHGGAHKKVVYLIKKKPVKSKIPHRTVFLHHLTSDERCSLCKPLFLFVPLASLSFHYERRFTKEREAFHTCPASSLWRWRSLFPEVWGTHQNVSRLIRFIADSHHCNSLTLGPNKRRKTRSQTKRNDRRQTCRLSEKSLK